MQNMSDSDKNSTQLEGKKLKGWGARLKSMFYDGELVEIEVDSPGQEAELGHEYFDEKEYGNIEREETREKRLQREKLAAQQQQQQLQKQQQKLQERTLIRDPNLNLNKVEQGVMLSQNKGKPVVKSVFNEHRTELGQDERYVQGNKHVKQAETGVVAAVLGAVTETLDVPKNVQISDKDKPPEGSIAAQRVQDIRSNKGVGIEV